MSSDLSSLVDGLLDEQDEADETTTAREVDAYIDAIRVDLITADLTYQRPLDRRRVNRMVFEFNPALVGVLEVSLRDDGTYRVIDGQHRLAMVREIRGDHAHIACNVHTGLTPEQEARLFVEIDSKRRRLTGWDAWNARRGAGEQAVLDIERVAATHGLQVTAATRDGNLRSTAAAESLVEIGGLELLDSTLQIVVAAYNRDADSLRKEIVHGTGLILAWYPDIDTDRLTKAMQGLAPRQVVARALGLRETVPGSAPRLAAHVLVDRYNAEPGKKVEPFLKHVPAGARMNFPAKQGGV